MTLVLLFDGAATGSLTATQQNQALSAAAGVVVGGALTATQGNQALSAAGGPIVGGALTATQGNQALAAAGGPIVGGAFTATQGNQTLAAAAGVLVGGAFTGAQANDVLAATAGAIVGGALAATQANQTLIGAANVVTAIIGSFIGTQAAAVLTATAAPSVMPSPRNFAGTVAVFDVLPNRNPGLFAVQVYGTPIQVGQPVTLVLSFGTMLKAPVILYFTSPTAELFPPDPLFPAYIGQVSLLQQQAIDPFTYIIYTTTFNQIGLWRLSAQVSSAQFGPYSFMVNP